MFARKSLLVIITTLFIKGAEVVLFYLATNKYSDIEFGYLTIARSFFTFFIFFSDLNFNLAHVKQMAEKTYPNSSYFSTYFMFKLILVPAITLTFFIIIQIEIGIGLIENSVLLNQTLGMMILAAIVNSINLVYLGSFQAEMKITKMQLGNVIATIVKSVLTVIVVFFVEGFIFYVSLFVVYELITLTINVILGRGYRFSSANRGLMKAYLKFGLFFLVGNAMTTFYSNFGPLFLESVLGDGALGVYYVVSRLLNFFTLIQNSLYVLLLPKISFNFKENDLEGIKKHFIIYQKYMLVFWGILSITCFGAGTVLLKLLGGDYEERGLVLLLFEVFVCFNWAWTPLSVMLLLKEEPIYLILILFNLLLSFFSWFFLPQFIGILALDFGKYASNIPNVIILSIYIQKKYGFGKPSKNVYINFVGTLGFITTELLFGFYRLPDLLAVGLTLLMVAVFILFLFVTRVLNKEDISFFKTVINPRKLYSEIKSDL